MLYTNKVFDFNLSPNLMLHCLVLLRVNLMNGIVSWTLSKRNDVCVGGLVFLLQLLLRNHIEKAVEKKG